MTDDSMYLDHAATTPMLPEAVAALAAESYPDRVAFVGLAPISDPRYAENGRSAHEAEGVDTRQRGFARGCDWRLVGDGSGRDYIGGTRHFAGPA